MVGGEGSWRVGCGGGGGGGRGRRGFISLGLISDMKKKKNSR